MATTTDPQSHHRIKSDHAIKRSTAHPVQQHHVRSSKAWHKKSASSKSLSKLSTREREKVKEREEKEVDREREKEEESCVMAASFLQFCASCEKQIIIPSNSVLYCSERCRKSDSLSLYTPATSEPPSPTSTTLTNFPFDTYAQFPSTPPKHIVPPRSPTVRSNRNSYISTSSDEGLTLNTHSTQPTPRTHSEAARYLRQFQSSFPTKEGSWENTPRARPPYTRSSTNFTASTATTAAPSLSHTPTSTTSLSSLPFTPTSTNYYRNERPLPSRHHPHSSSLTANRGIDLVTPYAVHHPVTAPSSLSHQERYAMNFKAEAKAAATDAIAEGELEVRFEKLSVRGRGYEDPALHTNGNGGSLGRLLERR